MGSSLTGSRTRDAPPREILVDLSDSDDGPEVELPTAPRTVADTPPFSEGGSSTAPAAVLRPRQPKAARSVEGAPPDHCGAPTCPNPNATCGQGGDHQ